MIPKRVLLENFLSFGEATTIEFTDEPLWVLSGPNGVGKSAVFDAITYCLFGCHRGTGTREAKVEELIRHGANGFRVEFDFECDGTDYRIVRNRVGRAIQKVQRRDPESGEWRAVAGVNSVTEVRAWAEETLGLNFDAFKASVLLRQGEADVMVSAGGAERGRLLRKVIDAERFETLSGRVHAATADADRQLKALRVRRDAATAVTDEDVAAARGAQAAALLARDEAAKTSERAAGRVVVAEQWAKLDAECRELDAQIAAADARAADADRIRADKARLDVLAAVPDLSGLVDARAAAESAAAELSRCRDEVERLTSERDAFVAQIETARREIERHRQSAEDADRRARDRRARIERDTPVLARAEQRAKLVRRLAEEFPADLEAQLQAARAAATKAAEEAATAGQRRAEVDALLRQAQEQEDLFDNVEIGVSCSRCGQKVTEEHAATERARLTRLRGELTEWSVAAVDAERIAKAAAMAAAAARDERDSADRARGKLIEQVGAIDRLGTVPDADTLRADLVSDTADAVRLETMSAEETAKRDAAAKAETVAAADRKARETARAKAQTKADTAAVTEAQAQATRTTLLGRLGPAWADQAGSITAPDVSHLRVEAAALTARGVAEAFTKLERETAVRDEWVGRRADLGRQIEAIAPDEQIAPAAAQQAVALARQQAKVANDAYDVAAKTADNLAHRLHEFQTLVTDLAAAERTSDRHQKLDEALGKDGLQRELVRAAEREIVRHANDTVRNLSDDDLSIELDAADGADEAFALRVRRAGDPTPIGVAYLSGSQKFRVAVSVALAIGRFAAGHSRRLESVIIDEGFGSLDRDGLAAMAEELSRLKQFLRRIVLVSHQEEFAEKFPIVVRLRPGENGTTVEAIRR